MFGNKITEYDLGTQVKSFPIHICHYVIKSQKEYQKKIEGTDVYFAVNSHSMKAFYFHDSKSVMHNDSMKKWKNDK